MYVIRRNKKGELVNSKPCKQCAQVMYTYGVKRVSYSDQNGKIISQKINELIDEDLKITSGTRPLSHPYILF